MSLKTIGRSWSPKSGFPALTTHGIIAGQDDDSPRLFLSLKRKVEALEGGGSSPAVKRRRALTADSADESNYGRTPLLCVACSASSPYLIGQTTPRSYPESQPSIQPTPIDMMTDSLPIPWYRHPHISNIQDDDSDYGVRDLP